MSPNPNSLNDIFPQHIAIIMDGNGRWAKERELERIDGHKAGAKSVRETVEVCRRLGIRYLTLFSFSTENWQRSKSEVGSLMELFQQYLHSELDSLSKNGVRLRAIGDLTRLPFAVRSALHKDLEKTKNNTGLDLILAISYGGREEIVHACKSIAEQVSEGKLNLDEIDCNTVQNSLWAPDVPNPDLLIRTSGEMRISNFLLWQLAYSEIVVIPEYWPDFTEEILNRCLSEYNARERRYGLTTEQLHEQPQKKISL